MQDEVGSLLFDHKIRDRNFEGFRRILEKAMADGILSQALPLTQSLTAKELAALVPAALGDTATEDMRACAKTCRVRWQRNQHF